MAKSKRSKVKMAYRTMRRAALKSRLDEQQRKQASKVYDAIGLSMPPSTRDSSDDIQPELLTRSHNGSDIVSTFVPTPKGPSLNAVHGPLAQRRGMVVEAPLVGFPIVGAGVRAKHSMDVDSRKRREEQGNEDDDDEEEEVPNFYHRKDYKRSALKRKKHIELAKKAMEKKKLNKLKERIEMDLEQPSVNV